MGLQCLHRDCKSQILHRGIKSNNILLDLDYEAHMGDIGTLKVAETTVSHNFSTIVGSLDYIVPGNALFFALNAV
ncbi:hypothetical protein M758_UG155700 [Ceratodon purpureus]|nr:hypothetical protein M758_UG155700 [Ceratodon purpureus]KAG0595286.1 hypothetical protein M758_UG155700 [Ceratodon purpureus]